MALNHPPPGVRVSALCGIVALSGGGFPAAAQREPVLQQIALPHNYYYREMYLPQATSGPSAVTWSPDGGELIYSMQGSLWRQRPGDSIARQLTAGPGYDYQPDWAPDGRRVVYASYQNDAIELRVLDLSTNLSRALTANGAVNVEPRWAPNGRSLAFVSTLYQGRFHIYTATVGDAGADSVTRITEDRDSKLPRYYYSTFDHYLSPTWSPDGSEIIFVSNRNHIWGSGGFWRMAPGTPAPPRPIHHEETTWRASPDWSRDGKRVVYSSYLGRQWNQLWLMTSDGGDPLQLTYGDYDATSPRWSPDGKRIAYISNEGGNTSLWVLEVPGGRRMRVEATQRRYLVPMGRLRIGVVDGQTGAPLPARVSLTMADGRSLAPDNAWRHADDGFDRSVRRMEYGYFHTAGSAVLAAPAGEVQVEITHGPEYLIYRQRVEVRADTLQSLLVRLRRLADYAAEGWTSGDLHVHMNYGGHYRATPATLALQARAEGLAVVENLIVNKEGRVPDVAYFSGRPDPVSSSGLLVAHDQEYHTSFWGHTGLLGLRRNLLLPGYAAYVNTAAASLYPDNGAIADLGHAQGALFGYVHPFEQYPDPADTTVGLTNALPVDVATGKVDYYEVVGFSDHLSSARVWYQLLNCGFRIAAGAGTDAMTNYASLRGPLGTNRIYVHAGKARDYPAWLAALRAGKTFATNGPLLEFRAAGAEIGQELTLPPRGGTVRFQVGLRSYVPVDHLEVVGRGEVVAAVPLRGRTTLDTTVVIPVRRSGWFTLRAWSEKAQEPILDIYPFASTSPIYVTVGGAPVRSKADAEYFIRWLGRLDTAARTHQGWNSEAEKRAVMGRIEAAREEFERRADEATERDRE